MAKDENLYGSKLISLPTPQFVVFYNGVDKQPEKKVFSLSDAYTIKESNVNLELKVLSLNINIGYNQELMTHCKSLQDYMVYVQKVREYQKTMPLEDAVDRAITECITEGRLVEFLSRHRAEAKNVSIYEYDEEKHMAQERAQAREEGHEAGLTEKLISQIRKKHAKNLTPQDCADMLEEDLDFIQIIYQLLDKYPHDNDNAIYLRLP